MQVSDLLIVSFLLNVLGKWLAFLEQQKSMESQVINSCHINILYLKGL